MTKNIITALSLLFSLIGFSQEELNPIIDKLRKQKIFIKKYRLTDTKDIPRYGIAGFSDTNVQMENVKITKNITLKTYSFTLSNYKLYHDDSFIVNCLEYNIDAVARKDKVKLYYNPYFKFLKYFVFEKDNDKIIIIKAFNRQPYIRYEVISFFVIRTYKDKVSLNLFYDVSN